MDGGTEDGARRARQAFDQTWAEAAADVSKAMDEISGTNAELAAMVKKSPLHPVTMGELAGLVAAYRRARVQADELRAALLEAGLRASEFPEFCASVDREGRAVIRLGTVSVGAGERLTRALHGRPHPPAERGRAA